MEVTSTNSSTYSAISSAQTTTTPNETFYILVENTSRVARETND